MGQSSAVALLHLRRLDRFLRHHGLHRTAHTLERESLAYFDAAHLRKLVGKARWDAAWWYLHSFSPLWEPEGDGTCQQFADFLRSLGRHAMLDFFACRGVVGGQARASMNWDDVKHTTLKELQELLHVRPGLECSLRKRLPQRTPTLSDMVPLGLRGSRVHRSKRVDRKPARELAHFFLRKRLPAGQDTKHSADSGVPSATLLQPFLASEAKTSDIETPSDVSIDTLVESFLASDDETSGIPSAVAITGLKRSRCQDDCSNAYQTFDPRKCSKRPRRAGDIGAESDFSGRLPTNELHDLSSF